jgi:mannobiose 2-epimerase
MDSSGQVLLDPVGGKVSDGIGTPLGQKSQNSLLHLMEAYTELYAVWPDPLLRARLAELLDWFRGRLMNPAGGQFGFTTRKGTGIPGSVSYGHDIEAAHLMLAAADALGVDCLAEAVALGENVLAFGWDEVHGGTFFSGPPGLAADRKIKNWWVQAEALLGFATLAARTGDRRFADVAARQWDWIRQHQIDPKFGGWYENVSEAGVPVIGKKGHSWKAAYHDGRALLFTARLLDDAKTAELFRAGA